MAGDVVRDIILLVVDGDDHPIFTILLRHGKTRASEGPGKSKRRSLQRFKRTKKKNFFLLAPPLLHNKSVLIPVLAK
jgi:hypothetical protein